VKTEKQSVHRTDEIARHLLALVAAPSSACGSVLVFNCFQF
jgi:hypothetical protein